MGAAVLALVGATATPASADETVADNLTSPLGFAVDDDGTLYVAEAFAGLLTKIKPNGDRSEIASAPPGSGTSGAAVTQNGSVYYTLTLPPEVGSPPETALGIVRPDGSTDILASLSDFEEQNNPDADNRYGIRDSGTCFERFSSLERFLGPAKYKGIVESNPYKVADEGYGSALVADAAGNDIVRVVNGKVSTVAVLPPINQTLDKPTVRKQMRQINRKLERRGKDPLPVDYLDPCIGKKYASNP
ncbi:MAG TPA: ScyD/ScyE family protein, partial [Actinomycetes bacterium]|nr:ScyD/ScyE family protein [Actinomycetes bacterium]